MRIIGTLTNYGETLVADSIANGTTYSITKIAAGSGDTALSADSINSHEMYLTMTTEETGGETVCHGILNMASATENFTLRELGLYVTKSTVRLFKIFKLSQPIEIDNTQNHTIRFSFYEKDMAGAVFDGYVMPESVVTYEILDERLEALVRYTEETVNYSCSAAGLEAVLASIPDCVEKDYVITLTEATVGSISIKNRYGKGSITIIGYDNAQTSAEKYTRVQSGIKLTDCTARINLQKLFIACTSYYTSSMDINRCSNVAITQCSLGATSEAYIIRVYDSTVFLESCYISSSKGSGTLLFSDNSHIRWSYKKADMFNRAFIESGTAFARVNSRSDITFLDELTESGLSMLTVTVTKGMMVTTTASGADARVRIY